MGKIEIGNKPVEFMSEDGLTLWIDEMTAGYKQRGSTIAVWVAILRVFDDVGPPMTVRQMFYRLVSLGIIQKEETSYRKVAYHLLTMRRRGLLPYSFISDSTRWMRKPTTWDSLSEMLQASASSYRRSIWTNQPHYVEVWCEKDALAGVFNGITNEYDLPLMVTRGFPSETFVYEGAQVLKSRNEEGKTCSVFYYGDFDPSGVAISTNLEERLQGFGADVQFNRVAVTPEQIRSMNLETRPTKKTDSRSKNFGGESVELDAIHPETLRQMVRQSIESVLDADRLQDIREAESLERESLLTAVRSGFLGTSV